MLSRVKKFIEPQVDGLYTIYDGDASLMKQYQASKNEKEKINPIEHNYVQAMGMQLLLFNFNFIGWLIFMASVSVIILYFFS